MSIQANNLQKIDSQYKDCYIAYTRKSTDDPDNQKNSIEYQEQAIRRDLERQGIHIAPLTIEGFCKDGFITEHHSGSKTDTNFETNPHGTISITVDRPKFLMLVGFLRKKKFKGVISLCWDRFSRNETDDMLTKKLLGQGVDIRFVQVKYEESSAGALHMDVDGMFSRHYSRALSEKVRNTNRKLREEGKCLYTPALGYLSEGSHSKPFDPERAPLVKRILELYATGEWGFTGLAKWANENGLTLRPSRRQRTDVEKLRGVELADIPKFARPVTVSTIWHMVHNPFYIGKIKFKGELFDSKAHQPLIDLATFYKIQSVLRRKAVKVYHPQFEFFTFRGLVKCGSCRRTYSPYSQKGISYYRTSCAKNCTNKLRNINDKFITGEVQKILSRIFFSEEEERQIENNSWERMDKLTENKNKEIDDLRLQKSKVMDNLKYLEQDKLSLLRTGVFTPEQIIEEEGRLRVLLTEYEDRLKDFSISTKSMLEYVISFSELVKHATAYFEHALDTEKRDIVIQVFSELYIEDGKLKYIATEAYNALLQRHNALINLSCGEDYIILELERIYHLVKYSNPILQKIISYSIMPRAA